MRARASVPLPTAVLLAVGSLLGGMALRGFVAEDPRTPAPSSTPSANTQVEPGAGPWAVDDGIPVGFAHSEDGATAAAVAYTTTGQVMLDLAPTQVAAAVRRYASAETVEQQIADTTAQLDGVRDALADGSGRTRYVQAVLASRLDAYGGDRARVAVWSVGVLWRSGAADPQAGWVTSTYDLVWEDDTWKVWAHTSSSGPSPAPNAGTPPVDAAELDRLLTGYESWRPRS